MASNNPLNALTGSTSLFNTIQSIGSASLFNRVNWVYGLFLVGLTYCAHNLYRAYQYTQHTSYGLNDSLKLAKCHALYAEAKSKNFYVVLPLLQQCEEMLVSITEKTLSREKEKLLVKLAQLYVENNPVYAHQMAENFSALDSLFSVATSLQQKNFNPSMIYTLFVKAYKAQDKKTLDLAALLQFSKVFDWRNDHVSSIENEPEDRQLTRACLTKALEIINNNEKLPRKVSGFCQIAQYHQEKKNKDLVALTLDTAQLHITDKTISAEAIEARLILADTFFSFGDFGNMNIELKKALKLIKTDLQPSAKNVYLLAKLQNKIKNTEQANKKFKKFDVESLIQKTFQNLSKNLSEGNRAEDCLTLASIYQEGLVKEDETKQNVLDKAQEYIDFLSETTKEEIKSKVDLLERLSSFIEDTVSKGAVVLKMKNLYNQLNQSDPASRIRQADIGSKILKIYNQAGFEIASKNFFYDYLANLQNTEAQAVLIIGQLVAFAQHIDHGGCLTTEQVKEQLQAAEALLPQIDSAVSYECTLALIAEGYSQINPQKSLKLLRNYQDKQAKSCVIPAIAPPILAGIMNFYPGTGLLLSGAYVVTRRMGLL